MTVWEWLIVGGIVFSGALIQGVIGFGIALVSAPLLYLVEPDLIPGPLVLTTLILPLMILAREWRSVQRTEAAWALGGQIPGIGTGIVILGAISESVLSLVFGSMVLVAVALSCLRRVGPPSPPVALGAGYVAGLMATTTAIGGPPLALAFQHVSGPRLRGTLSAVFAPTGVAILGALWLSGHFGRHELLLGLGLLPPVVAGFAVSGPLAPYLDRGWLRPTLLAVSALAAIGAIITAAR